ncbi:MAG: hypothetical protein COX29_02885, partial [Candidatus Moranbacteria bacterium CG23_combo_of_CG06-09_8_20_14_all_35_22]
PTGKQATVSLIWGSFCVRMDNHFRLMLYWTRLKIDNFFGCATINSAKNTRSDPQGHGGF